MSSLPFLALFVTFLASAAGQNQPPPGLRKPPFIVVPPENERRGVVGSASERVDVFADQPSLNRPQSVPLPQGHPNNLPQSVPPGGHKQPPVAVPPQGNIPFPAVPPQGNIPFPADPPQGNIPFPAVPPQGNIPFPAVPPQGNIPFPAVNPLPPSSVHDDSSGLSPENIKLVEQTLDRTCLNCLCQASTKCEKTECILTGPDQYFCGPYQISFAYWADSGKPGDNPSDPHAFEKCLKNVACAERAILGYMSKYARDCNGDGKFDCQDVALIHKGGPHNCNGQWIFNTEYWRRFGSCWGGAGTVDFRSSPLFGKK